VKTALITGVTGQDGSYLAELLIRKGYKVHGLVRRASTFNTARIEEIYSNTEDKYKKLHIHYIDSVDSLHLFSLIESLQPSEIYNLASLSHVGQSFDQPEYVAETAGIGLLKILEIIKILKIKCKIYQASTSEMFGSTPPPQNENSMFNPLSPYAAAKLYAYNISRQYRDAYGIHITNGILFNHESPRRSRTFVTRKITTAVAEIIHGKRTILELGNLNSKRDWGYAPEYVEAMWNMLQLDDPVDLVIATGQQHSVMQFCEFAFSHVGLDLTRHVRTSNQFYRPLEVESLLGDYSQANKLISWKPKILAPELARIMVDSDLKLSEFRF
jgi:GDPmannose 4,6-dehydratase